MFFALFAQVLTFLLDLLVLPWRSSREKDLEILLLRHQLAILQRTQSRPARPTRRQRLVLALLAAKLAALGSGFLQRRSGMNEDSSLAPRARGLPAVAIGAAAGLRSQERSVA
jgi:hypothetical protein